MRRVVFNQKGGVGKSTITCNLAAIGAVRGARTLVVDLDPQGNTTQYLLGAMRGDPLPGVADFFDQVLNFKLNPRALDAFVTRSPYPGLDLMASQPALEDLQGKLESRYKIYKLREALERLGEDYTRIWVDTPPALNFFTRSALIAADRCLIPFDCDDFSRTALYTLLANVEEIRTDHNRGLAVEGIVVNQFQTRAALPRRIVGELEAEGLPVLRPYLSSSVRIRESHERSCPMIHMDARHKVTQEYLELHSRLDASGT